MSLPQEIDPLSFLDGGGEMGELTRRHDWAATPLGAPAQWPAQLKATVRLILTSGHPMFIWWGPGLIQFYNDAYRRSLGPERHPMALGQEGRQCWEEIWHIIGPQIEMVMQGRGSSWDENALVPTTRNGKREDIYWTYSYSPIDAPDAPNGVGGVLVVCSETSDQVIARAQQTAERDLLRQLFRQAPGFMVLLRGPEHRIEMANPAYMKLVGHRDIIGKPVAEAVPDAVEQGYLRLLDQAFASGQAVNVDGARLMLTDAPGGEPVERFLDFVYQPVTDAEGRVTGIFVEGFDVTRAHRDSVVLRQLHATLEERVVAAVAERNILADVVECADARILVVDLDLVVLALNKAYADEFRGIHGRSLQVGDNLVSQMDGDPGRVLRIHAYWKRALAGEDFQVIEAIEHPASGRRHYDARFNALRDRSGTRVGAFVLVYDVTERVREQARLAEAEERLRQTRRIEALGQLTGGVAHDFNNLLMVISGGIEVLEHLAPSRRAKVLDGMRQAVDRGASLSRQLLAFSRRQPLDPEPIDVASTIGGMREMLERSLRGDVQVTLAFDQGLWPVDADAGQLELAVLNLAVNARDAMPDGGLITLGARNAEGMDDEALRGDFVETFVTDNGSGMPPEVLARAFEPFFTTKDIGKGSGLGLAQAHGFAHASGGALRIRSEVGQGTTVLLYLPRSSMPPRQSSVTPEPQPVQLAVEEIRGQLLLVEDDDEVAALTDEMLRALGYRVLRVAHAQAALEALARHEDIDVVFSDVMMPGGLDGIDLVEESRRRRPGLAVLLATGHVEAAREKAQALGVTMLAKPYRLKELEAALDRAMSRPARDAE